MMLKTSDERALGDALAALNKARAALDKIDLRTYRGQPELKEELAFMRTTLTKMASTVDTIASRSIRTRTLFDRRRAG